MTSLIVRTTRAPNLQGLTQFQRDHVLLVFPETRASMADYLREGTKVYVYRQDEVSDVPPFAIAVVSNPAYWVDCLESESAAFALAAELGLVVVNIDPRTT